MSQRRFWIDWSAGCPTAHEPCRPRYARCGDAGRAVPVSVDHDRLIRRLRRLRAAGVRELYLETLTADEALAGAGASGPAERAGRGERGGSAAELPVFREQVAGCTRCRLHEGRRSVVFGEGSPTADVVVVGEAPGREEDRTGRPFVGPAGKLLDRLLMTIGLPREQVFICNVLKCRPPKNRDPRPDEVECCSPYLHRQLEIISPRVLLAVGKFAAQTLTGRKGSLGGLRGEVHTYRGIPLIASYHPAYLLRSPSRARASWEDLQLLRQVLDEHA